MTVSLLTEADFPLSDDPKWIGECFLFGGVASVSAALAPEGLLRRITGF